MYPNDDAERVRATVMASVEFLPANFDKWSNSLDKSLSDGLLMRWRLFRATSGSGDTPGSRDRTLGREWADFKAVWMTWGSLFSLVESVREMDLDNDDWRFKEFFRDNWRSMSSSTVVWTWDLNLSGAISGCKLAGTQRKSFS